MSARILRRITLYMLLVTIPNSTMAWSSSDKMKSQTLRYSQEKHTLTVQVDNAQLSEVLQTLANQIPATITLKGFDQHIRLSRNFTNLPFEQGIERLLQGQDYALLYSRIHSSREPRLKEIIVVPRLSSSTKSISSYTDIVMSPMTEQRVSTQDTLRSHGRAQESQLIQLASQVADLVQQSPLDSTHHSSTFTPTIHDQNPLLRAVTQALLDE